MTKLALALTGAGFKRKIDFANRPKYKRKQLGRGPGPKFLPAVPLTIPLKPGYRDLVNGP